MGTEILMEIVRSLTSFAPLIVLLILVILLALVMTLLLKVQSTREKWKMQARISEAEARKAKHERELAELYQGAKPEA